MVGDMVVALGRATVDGHTLFGHNRAQPFRSWSALCRTMGRAFAPGETVRVGGLELGQARQTYTVVGSQPAGCWGYQHGVNESGVAAGCTSYRSKLSGPETGLSGTDLVRLVLERARSARQGVEVVTDLVERHGRGPGREAVPSLAPPSPHPRPLSPEYRGEGWKGGDSGGACVFLLADAAEALCVEVAARHWVCQDILEVRAASNVCTIRQDWNRISAGLGEEVIQRGWWPGDGSKLDFAETVGDSPIGEASALRRWGRATLLLEQQNGHIDAPFLRRLLADHYEGTHFEVEPLAPSAVPVPLCQHARRAGAWGTTASLVAQLARDEQRLSVVGCAFGPPCLGVYFPVFVEGELPATFSRGSAETALDGLPARVGRLTEQFQTDPQLYTQARERLARLQAEFDQEGQEFAAAGAALKQRGDSAALQHQAGALLQHHLERFDATVDEILARSNMAEARPVGAELSRDR